MLEKLNSGRLSEKLAKILQTTIIDDELQAGAKLPTEPALMEKYGVSRTVVREAAALLVSRGLVEVRPRRGMTVREPDGHGLAESLIAQLQMNRVSLSQLLEVRISLECAIARIAASSRTEGDISRLQAIQKKLSNPEVSKEEAVEMDLQFHEALAKATHNPFFSLVTKPINELLRSLYLDKIGYMSLRKHTVAEHNVILDAVIKQQPESADLATRVHLGRVGKSVQAFINEEKGTRQ